MTSHAAVVARGMGKPCVVGCENININYDKKEFVTSTGMTVREGDVITIDGATGNVYVGDLPKVRLATVPEFQDTRRPQKGACQASTHAEGRLQTDIGCDGRATSHYKDA